MNKNAPGRCRDIKKKYNSVLKTKAIVGGRERRVTSRAQLACANMAVPATTSDSKKSAESYEIKGRHDENRH